MKTLVCTHPGKLEYRVASKPVLTKGQAIVKVRRIGICGTDLHAFEGTQPFFNYPRILGHELAGELVQFDNAPGFNEGEAVTILPYFSCNSCVACMAGKPNCCIRLQVCGVHVDGGMVEFLSVPSSCLMSGGGLNFDELALIEPLAVAAHGVQRANIKSGEFVLVIGAGPIGLATMEFARIAGGSVIAMDINEHRLEFCSNKISVPHVLNALTPYVAERLREVTYGDMPAVVIDATGNLKSINNAFQYMAHGGRYVLIGLQKENISFSHPEFHKKEGMLMSSRNATRQDFDAVINAIKSGALDPTAYITHRLAFDDLQENFGGLLDPGNGVIKAMVETN